MKFRKMSVFSAGYQSQGLDFSVVAHGFGKAPAFALGAEAEILEEQDRVDRERVIELDDIDIFTSVNVNGVKVKSDQTAEECLIRAFV